VFLQIGGRDGEGSWSAECIVQRADTLEERGDILLLLMLVTVGVAVRAGHDLGDADGSDEGESSELHCGGGCGRGGGSREEDGGSFLLRNRQMDSYVFRCSRAENTRCDVLKDRYQGGYRREAVSRETRCQKECTSGVLLKGRGRWEGKIATRREKKGSVK
jgi:hypothetical protein